MPGEFHLVRPPDIPAVRAMLLRAPHHNLFALDALTAAEHGRPDRAVWYYDDKDHSCVLAVVNRTCSLCVPMAADPRVVATHIDLLSQTADISVVAGTHETFHAVLRHLPSNRLGASRSLAFAHLDQPRDAFVDQALMARVRQVGVDDLRRIDQCYADGEWAANEMSRREALEEGRLYALEQHGRVVAAAYVQPLVDSVGIIRGVYTPKTYRGRGYATALVAEIDRRMLAEGVVPCLMYDNPAAGRIYHRLGYRDFDRWCSVQLLASRH